MAEGAGRLGERAKRRCEDQRFFRPIFSLKFSREERTRRLRKVPGARVQPSGVEVQNDPAARTAPNIARMSALFDRLNHPETIGHGAGYNATCLPTARAFFSTSDGEHGDRPHGAIRDRQRRKRLHRSVRGAKRPQMREPAHGRKACGGCKRPDARGHFRCSPV